MKLYLIRHAESTNNASWGKDDGSTHVRVPDPEITETGHKQSRFLAEFLASPGNEPRQTAFKHVVQPDFGIDKVYCSLMNRSIMTAEYIGAHCGVEVEALPDVFERMGLFEHDGEGNPQGIEGPGRTYFEQRFPGIALPEALSDQGWWNRPVENSEQFFKRVGTSLETIASKYSATDARIALVVHGDYLDQAINHLMDAPRRPQNYTTAWVANWIFHNTSVSRIDITGDARNVIYLNRIDHLPNECITW